MYGSPNRKLDRRDYHPGTRYLIFLGVVLVMFMRHIRVKGTVYGGHNHRNGILPRIPRNQGVAKPRGMIVAQTVQKV